MKKLSALAALALLVGPAHALSLTCTETVRIELEWKADHWEPAELDLQVHTVRSVDRDEKIGDDCFERMDKLGMSTDPQSTFSGATSAGCYSLTVAGMEEASYLVTPCRQTEVDGVIREVTCSNAQFDNIGLLVDGEFALTNTFAGIVLDEYISDTRDPVALALGRCKVKAP